MTSTFDRTSEGHALDRLVGKMVHETLTVEEHQRLENILKDSSHARIHFLRHIDIHSRLAAHWGIVDSLALPAKRNTTARVARRQIAQRRYRNNSWAIAASLAFVALGAVIWQVILSSRPSSIEVLTNSSDESFSPGQTLSQGSMSITEGSATFILASEVTIEASGETSFDVIDSMNLKLTKGTITADAALMDGDGFTVHTPHATITDLGTRFGVINRSERHTDVVVFSGMVSINSAFEAPAAGTPAVFLGNQAVRIRADQSRHRLGMVELSEKGRGLSASEAEAGQLIAAITDNSGLAHNFSYYGVIRSSMKAGSPAFQRTHAKFFNTKKSFPPELAGADVILPPTPVGNSTDIRITVELTQPCSVYVITDERAPIPKWLNTRFVDTGIRLRTGPWDIPYRTELRIDQSVEPDFKGRYYLHHAVWRKDAPAGPLELGPPRVAGSKSPQTMYGIAVKALPDQDATFRSQP